MSQIPCLQPINNNTIVTAPLPQENSNSPNNKGTNIRNTYPIKYVLSVCKFFFTIRINTQIHITIKHIHIGSPKSVAY